MAVGDYRIQHSPMWDVYDNSVEMYAYYNEFYFMGGHWLLV